MLVKLHSKPSWGNFGFHIWFLSFFCIRETPWSPQIRVGSAGTVEGWPRMQTNSCQGEVTVWEERELEDAIAEMWMKLQFLLMQNSRILVLTWGEAAETKVLVTFQEKKVLVGIGMSTSIWALLGSGRFQESFGSHFSSILYVSLFYYFLFYWLQFSYGIEIFWIAVLKQYYL